MVSKDNLKSYIIGNISHYFFTLLSPTRNSLIVIIWWQSWGSAWQTHEKIFRFCPRKCFFLVSRKTDEWKLFSQARKIYLTFVYNWLRQKNHDSRYLHLQNRILNICLQKLWATFTANPLLRNAQAVVALQLILWTVCSCTAVRLIGKIVAIIVTVCEQISIISKSIFSHTPFAYRKASLAWCKYKCLDTSRGASPRNRFSSF